MFDRQLNLIRLLMAIAVLLMVGPRPAWANTESIVIIHLDQPSVDVTTEIVTVGDVAKVVGGPIGLRQKIQSLDLDEFAEDQDELDISAKQVRYRLLLARVEQDAFQIIGTGISHVQRISAADYQQRIEQLLTTELAIQFGLPTEAVQVTLAERDFQSLLQSDIDFSTSHLTTDFGAELPVGRRIFEVRFVDATGNQFTHSVPLTTAVFRHLVIAQKNISRGETIDETSVMSVRRPISNGNTRFASYEQVIGKTANQDIQQFDVVRVQNVSTVDAEARPIIKRNQLVNAVLRRGGLTIHVKNARTMTDGKLGDTIEILNPMTRKRMLAIVVGPGAVEIR